METSSAAWTVGDRIIVRAATCTIVRTERFAGCEELQLAPAAPPDTPFGALLVPFDRPRRITRSQQPRAVRPRRWLHAVRRTAAHHHPFGALRCAARARIDLLPYQLEPALAMLRHGSVRILLADAVGLGKTIQAGLILAEVLHQDAARRALVVLPAGLRHQWQSELARRFAVDAALCDASWLRHRARELPPDANPWALPGTYLISLDFIKRPEVLKALEDLLWDIVIVDEAHVVTSGTDRRAAVDAVAARARRVLLLTGTPHSGDERKFDALCGIGEGPARTPLVLFRRGRDLLGAAAVRRSVVLRVRISDAERRMHQLLDRYAARLWRESRARGDRRAALVAIVLRKRALSSAASLVASLARRLDLLCRTAEAMAFQLTLPLDDSEEPLEDSVPDDVLGAPGLANPVLERRWLAALLEAARRAARGESKVTRLRRLLARVAEPAIVFTEYRDTLVRLQRALHTVRSPILALHGGMSGTERRAVQHAFNHERALLLATDAAAEGLNLHRLCRLVVHFELPWNPLRLEQRAGRVDRFGQTRRVHEVALVADGTVERIVLAPLARRARRAQAVAAGGSRMLELLSEARVADAVMTGDASALESTGAMRIGCTELQLGTEAAAEAARLADERRWLTSERRFGADGRPVVTVARSRTSGEAAAVILLYSLSLAAAGTRVVHAEPLLLHLAVGQDLRMEQSAPGAIRALQRILQAARTRLDAIVARRFRELEANVIPMHAALLGALRARERNIARTARSAARHLVQAGLFDRRAIREAERRSAAEDRLDEEAGRSLRSLAAAESLARSVKLEAALIRIGRAV